MCVWCCGWEAACAGVGAGGALGNAKAATSFSPSPSLPFFLPSVLTCIPHVLCTLHSAHMLLLLPRTTQVTDWLALSFRSPLVWPVAFTHAAHRHPVPRSGTRC